MEYGIELAYWPLALWAFGSLGDCHLNRAVALQPPCSLLAPLLSSLKLNSKEGGILKAYRGVFPRNFLISLVTHRPKRAVFVSNPFEVP